MDWKGKKVVVIGLARQGISLTQYFVKQGAHVLVSDLRDSETLRAERQAVEDEAVTFQFGEHPLYMLDDTDLLCLSGGVSPDIPVAVEALRRGIPISNDSQIFLDECPATTVGITGSAGKTTTVSLLGHLAQTANDYRWKSVWVGGNIGRPLLDDLDDISEDDLVIIELSSFQLELMSSSTDVAAMLNLMPNHLDRHGTMEAYIEAKRQILLQQHADSLAILNRDDPVVWGLRTSVPGKIWTFGQGDPAQGNGVFVERGGFWLRRGERVERLAATQALAISGDHNIQNAAAALAVAAAVGISLDELDHRLGSFEGVEHRLEFVREVGDVRWVNDSIATSPERAIAAMNAFDNPIVLLAGGRDKHLPWNTFAEVAAAKTRALILFGEARGLIEASLRSNLSEENIPVIISVEDLAAAIERAAGIAEPGDVVLLAPGGTSFDAYPDFAARGEFFREQVEAL